MNSRHVGVRIARRLQTAEHAVDRAMIETTALIQAMIEGRADAGFAADVGHPALLNVVRGLNQIAVASAEAAVAATAIHNALREADGWTVS